MVEALNKISNEKLTKAQMMQIAQEVLAKLT
jgi:hypothetical protein